MKHWWQPEKPASYQERAFHEFFYDTVVAMESSGILVLDMIPGVSCMLESRRNKGKVKAIVSVSWMGNWKKSLFVLLHELGHVASVRIKNGSIAITIRKSPSSERIANITACNLLVGFGFEDVVQSYIRMYNDLNKKAIKTGLRKTFRRNEK